ncbi:MAG: AAA family ATPase [Enterovibrio sp.]
MNIKQLHLARFGCFDQLEVKLAPTEQLSSKITVFIGNNGAGKTLLLKALMTNLSWFVAHLRGQNEDGKSIVDGDILNGKASAKITVTLADRLGESNSNKASEENVLSWSLAKTRSGSKAQLDSYLDDAIRLADHYKALLAQKQSASLPLIAFYPVNRAQIDVPAKIQERHNFLQIDGYDNSLEQGVDFRRFFEWVREREELENEPVLPQDLLGALSDDSGAGDDACHAFTRDKQLAAVRSAISSFMPGFSNLKVRRKPRLHMSIDKRGQTLNVLQLSQGEKTLMGLVGDIARRLVMMNPALANPLQGEGIVLIDEIDMHLHPTWQRSIIERLTVTFPNCQFILTTHSPLLISEQPNALVYSLDDGEISGVNLQ